MANAFQLDELDGQIAQVTFNVPDKKVNTLSAARSCKSWPAWPPSSKSGPTCAGCCFAAPSRASSSPEPI